MDASAQPSQVMQEHVTKPENPFYGVKRDFVSSLAADHAKANLDTMQTSQSLQHVK